MKILKITLSLFTAVILFSGTANSGRHHYPKGKMTRFFDPATVIKLKGVIVKINYKEKMIWDENQVGVYLKLRTPKENIEVHLGPAWFVNEKIKFNNNDKIEVIGSRQVYAFREIIIAKEITKDKEKIVLRKDDGTPLWSGRGIRSKSEK